MNEVVRVDRVVEIIPPLIRIVVTVNLPKPEPWFLVEFFCWGQSCGTVFLTIEEALRWCAVCYDKNLMRPAAIKDREGVVLYDEDKLVDYCHERT